MIVVDASALINALTSKEGPGKAARDRDGLEEPAAPALLDWEVASVLPALSKPRQGREAKLSVDDRDLAMEAYERLTIVRYSLHPLWPRMQALSTNLSSYDASYVALAEKLGVPLVTADRRIERGAQTSASIEIVWTSADRQTWVLRHSAAKMKTSSCPLHADAVFLGEARPL